MLEFIKYIYIGFLIIPIYSVFRLLRQYWLYIGYKALNSSFLEWDSKTERARIYLFFLGLLLFISAFTIKNIKSDDSLNYTLLFPSMLICILANLLLVFIWTKKFKLRYNSNVNSTTEQILDSTITNIEASKSIEPNTLIEKPNTDPIQKPVIVLDSTKKADKTAHSEKLFLEIQSSLYNDNLNLTEVLKNFPQLKCENDTFKNFLLGNTLKEKYKIVCSFPKAQLIRFIIIIYNLSNNEEPYHNEIKGICEHYFITKDKAPFSFRSPSGEITDAFTEKKENANTYKKDLNKIKAIFSQNHTKNIKD